MTLPAADEAYLICPVILSGGGGTRLWPLSTRVRPKQFLPLAGDRSLFEATLARVTDRSRFLPPVIVTNESQCDLCTQDLAISPNATIILEPLARNTAAAIFMAAERVSATHGPETLMLVMPSDHIIANPDALLAAVQTAAPVAQAGMLVTFGIQPTKPETGYGYIETGPPIGDSGVLDVARFVEKPPLDVAEAYVAGGRHLWNAGIFLFSAKAIREAGRALANDIADPIAAAMAMATDEDHIVRPSRADVERAPSRSIDHAVFELSDKVATIPVSAGWSDVGSWDSLIETGFHPSGEDRVTLVDCSNVYAHSDGVHIAVAGVQDLIVVAHGDRLLIVPRGQSQDVKRIVEALKSNGRGDLL